MKKNNDVRTTAKKRNVYLYEIAEVLGIGETTFCRHLRKELSAAQKDEIYAAIDIIAEQKEKTGEEQLKGECQ